MIKIRWQLLQIRKRDRYCLNDDIQGIVLSIFLVRVRAKEYLTEFGVNVFLKVCLYSKRRINERYAIFVINCLSWVTYLL